ncbi:conserved hypothetical membrane protein [Parafrankia sp. EAN1pec]|uniref:hypothetical protein n=1 Tax=Parafrankia sp. (strain EAN1pec) TaxID=298653 RepID=UPI00015DA0F8|nr:conserved hypothetical membrane protein [Frankia sp. EAN1pec]
MNLDAATPGLEGGRFYLVDYLPTCAATIFVLTLVWAGAPGSAPDFDHAWQTAARLGAGEVLAVTLAVILGAALGHPLQLGVVRLLEGGWPRWAAPVTRGSRALQLRRRARLAARAELPQDENTEPSYAVVQTAGLAGARLRRGYPLEDLVRPTALGNVLAAMEWQAGEPYGLDAVVTWPRLYPVLGEPTRLIVTDRRNTLDGAARLSVTMAATAATSAALLLPAAGWWACLALIPLAIARLAYVGAVRAALAYSESVRAAFDLHRFDLLTALHLPLPDDPDRERALNQELSSAWRQGTPTTSHYDHPGAVTSTGGLGTHAAGPAS